MATPPFLHQHPPPLSGLSPPSDSIFGRSYPPPPLIRGWGGEGLDDVATMDYFVLRDSIFLWYIMVFITYGKYYTTNIFIWHPCFKTCFRTNCLLSNYYTFKRNILCCDGAWKHYPVYKCILSIKQSAPQIFLFDGHAWKHDSTQTHHSNHQMLNWNVFFVSWPGLKMFCSVYCQSQVHSKYFCLAVRLNKIISMKIIGYNNVYLLCKYHTLEWKYFFFMAWLENILQFLLSDKPV